MKFTEFVPVDMYSLTSSQAAELESMFECSGPDAVKDISINNFAFLRSLSELKSMPDKALMEIGIQLVYQLLRNMGGTAIYLPNGGVILAREKASLVLKEFNGSNMHLLSRKHGLTTERVRQILQKKGLKKGISTKKVKNP